MKILIKFCLVATLLCVQFFHAEAQSPVSEETAFSTLDWNERRLEAMTKYSEEKYEEVVRLLKDFPEDDTAWVEMNVIYVLANLRVKDFRECIAGGLKGLDLKPGKYRKALYELVGMAYYELGNYDSSLLIYQTAQKDFEGLGLFYGQIGYVLKEMKQYDKAVAYLQEAVRLNPFNGLAHYNLGLICMENNYMIPAMLSFQMVLLVHDDADERLSALTLYEKMAKGGWQVPRDSLYWSMPGGQNNFQDIEQLIRSKIAFSDKYKSKVDLQYLSIVKQMQLLYEQIQYNAADTGFWMQYYVPYIRKVWESDHFPASVYYCFNNLTSEEAVKQVKRNQSAISKMKDFANGYWSKKRVAYWLNNKLVESNPMFNENGMLTSIGEYDEKRDVLHGHWKFISDRGFILKEGWYDTNGREQGVWKYYDEVGRLESIRTAKDGFLEDSMWTYYPNGNLDELSVYKDGELNGVSAGYYYNGAISGRVGYEKGKLNGVYELYHDNGAPRLKGQYMAGKCTGDFVEYYENGNKSSEYHCVDGTTEGEYKIWHQNGTLKAEGQLKDGYNTGLWNFYDEKGSLIESGKYLNGDLDGVCKIYKNGQLERQSFFIAGSLSGEDLIYNDGKLWSKMLYEKDVLISYEYYDKNGNIVSKGKRDETGLLFKSMTPDGRLAQEGFYNNKGKNGIWKYWTLIGGLEREDNYKDGNLEGEQKFYYPLGALRKLVNYKNGLRNGLAKEYYPNGHLLGQTMFLDDEKNGYCFEYYPDETLKQVSYCIGNLLNGRLIKFAVNGIKLLECGYYLDHLQYLKSFDSTGVMLTNVDFPTCNVSFTMHEVTKAVSSEVRYKYGKLDKYKSYNADGTIRVDAEYAVGRSGGFYKQYDLSGNLSDHVYNKGGNIDSLRVIYEDGRKLFECYYKNDLQEGKEVQYYPNGKVQASGNYSEDKKDGEFMYYSYNGELRLRMKYKNGLILSYSYWGPDSNFVSEIPLKDGCGRVVAYYPNGNTAADFTVTNGCFDGELTFYFPDKKIERKSFFRNGGLQGACRSYYPDGKLWRDEMMGDNNLDGTSKYYYENGKLHCQVEYKMGKLHGAALIYDETGKLIKKNKCYNDETIE